MRYELLKLSTGAESIVYDVQNKEAVKDEAGNITEEAKTIETPTDEYSCSIELVIRDKETINPSDTFQKSITVISHNKQTGFEVDTQREAAIKDYIDSINK